MPNEAAPFHFPAQLPLSLYIHMPWCVSKCPYCDFNSFAIRRRIPEATYIDTLLCDLVRERPYIEARALVTVFIGGGTPSLFSPEAIDRLLSGIRTIMMLDVDVEITLESNPGTLEPEKLKELRAIGVNRLSIGIQSFNDELLRGLGRIHDGATAIRAAEMAHCAGFDNFNIDLMYGLPGQSEAVSHADIATAIQMEPTHISYYELTIEPNTRFYVAPPSLPSEDVIWAMRERTDGILLKHGYTQYEISAYARRGGQCRHNINYWNFGDYVGIGAGAHGKLTHLASQSIFRRIKYSQPRRYMALIKNGETGGYAYNLSVEDAKAEFLMNTLRLTEGFDLAVFNQRTGLASDRLQPELDLAVDRGLLHIVAGRVSCTELGKRFLNDVVALFLPHKMALNHECTN